AAVIVLEWMVLDGIARSGASSQIAAYQSVILINAGMVLLYAHWAQGMELATIVGSALFGITIATAATKADASAAIPAGVCFLPVLALTGRVSTSSQVPLASFWLIGLAPLALAPFLIPWVARRNRWLLIAVRPLLVLIP